MSDIRIILIKLIKLALLKEKHSVIVVLLDVPELFLERCLVHNQQR